MILEMKNKDVKYTTLPYYLVGVRFEHRIHFICSHCKLPVNRTDLYYIRVPETSLVLLHLLLLII